MGKRVIDLAIVIPTLNEEKYIGGLLESIARQTIQPAEVVVVDAFSTDKTEEVVSSWKKKIPQLRFYQIPKDTISKQRNYGVKKSKSAKILFLDADTALIGDDTLEKYIQEVEEKHAELENRLIEATSAAFIEKIARDKLGLVREGETVVIMDKSPVIGNQSSVKEESNWRKWWGLFF